MGLFDKDRNAPAGGRQNGPTDRGSFVGTCQSCGIVWEFENAEVIPAPYPHGTCPRCGQWVRGSAGL